MDPETRLRQLERYFSDGERSLLAAIIGRDPTLSARGGVELACLRLRNMRGKYCERLKRARLAASRGQPQEPVQLLEAVVALVDDVLASCDRSPDQGSRSPAGE